MKFKSVGIIGLGVIAGLIIDKLMTDEGKNEVEMAKSYLKEQFKNKEPDDTDKDLTEAMELSKDDTPDNVDMLFIDPVRFTNISVAYSIMGEVMNAFENGGSVSVHDILRWLDDYEGYSTYVYNTKLEHGAKLKEFGWVDPSDFAIVHNDTLDGYTITTAVPVRLKKSDDE